MWKELKVGDKVLLVTLPPEFFQPGYYIHKDTLRVYKRVLARNKPLRVYEIKDGLPWVQVRFTNKAGKKEWHYLAFNHDGIQKVKG